MLKQYNSKIDAEFKQELTTMEIDSKKDSRQEFLKEVVNGYKVYKTQKMVTNIDVSNFKNLNDETKKAMQKSFQYLLSLIDGNFAVLSQEKLAITS
jgi:hypothetical protein